MITETEWLLMRKFIRSCVIDGYWAADTLRADRRILDHIKATDPDTKDIKAESRIAIYDEGYHAGYNNILYGENPYRHTPESGVWYIGFQVGCSHRENGIP